MLMQVGSEGLRPTFFEMVAAQQLPASLRAALFYSLGVMAQRRPVLHKVLDYGDEVFAALMLLLEAHNLNTSDASFAEGLYGLRRRSAVPTSESEALSSARSSAGPVTLTAISRRQRNLSVFFLVVIPYLKSKMEAAYIAQRGGALQATFWGTGDSDSMEMETVNADSTSGTQRLSPDATIFERVKSKLQKIFSKFIRTEYYSPALHFLRVQVGRASGQELIDASKQVTERRKREFERLRGSPVLQAVQRGLLRTTYGILDYAQSGLIATVFLFKMMEWWYQSAEQRLTSPTVYPPPPPPPAPQVAKDGIPLPEDRTSCPLCLRKRTNPAMVAVSGYVFCYPCIYNYVNQYKRCPVTLVSASEEKIRRLYHDA